MDYNYSNIERKVAFLFQKYPKIKLFFKRMYQIINFVTCRIYPALNIRGRIGRLNLVHIMMRHHTVVLVTKIKR